MREPESDPAIADELNDFLTGDLPDVEAGELLAYLAANPELLTKAQAAAAAIDDVQGFPQELPSATAVSADSRSWHTHRGRRPVTAFHFRWTVAARQRGAVRPEGAVQTRGGPPPRWSAAAGEILLDAASDLTVRLDDEAPVPGTGIFLVPAEPGQAIESVIEYEHGEPIARFESVPPGRYSLEFRDRKPEE